MQTNHEELVQTLLLATIKKKLRWNRTALDPKCYEVQVGDARYQIKYTYDMSVYSYCFKLIMINSEGTEVALEEIYTSGSQDWNLLEDLFNVAEDSFTNESDTIEQSIHSLKKLLSDE